MNTDISIFTNLEEIKLKDRLNIILTNSLFFDILVGYFRLTGFHLIQDSLKDVQEIRILIGLGADFNQQRHLDIFDISGKEAFLKVNNSIRNEFASSENSLEVENGVDLFLEWIKSGKLQVKMTYEKNVHAKVYIVRKNPKIVPDQYGYLITGSSNLSYSGLQKNIEFNVELKNRSDVEYALNFYELLWKDAIDVTDKIVDVVNNDTWMISSISPYEMYLKTLIEYFKEELEEEDLGDLVPPGFLKLEYQRHAVIQAKRVLERHGGVLISDVVGLGKTYIAAMLAKTMNGKKLFLVPPIVKSYWEEILFEFGISSYKVESVGKIDVISNWENIADFSHVFVDEAHRFRNSESQTYQQLKRICYNKKVILITATPQNNTINDIASLIRLFQNSRRSSIIPENPNLDTYFKNLSKRIKNAKDSSEYEMVLSDVANEVRNKVLRHVMIRRTRTEISSFYKEDMQQQEISFPFINDPFKITYTYNDEMEIAFDKTIDLIKKLKYARYTPLLYVKDQKLLGDKKSGQENMKGFIKSMLIKRLESSIFAFSESINRLHNYNAKYLDMYDNNIIIIGAMSKKNKIDMDQLSLYTDNELEELVSDKDLTRLKCNDLIASYRDDLENDLVTLKEIKDLWNTFNTNRDDSKFDELLSLIKDIKKEDKLIIFTEAKDTLDYLENRLMGIYPGEVVAYSGSHSNSRKEYIKQNYDPSYGENALDEIKILLTTDALSEGVNLHLSNKLINYDLPWNPTRVMQRIGRINRIGSPHNELFVYNFFPAANTNKHLPLEESIKYKIQVFHHLLGEDSKFLTADETVNTFGLYDIVMMSSTVQEEVEHSYNTQKTRYLTLIGKYKRDYPTEYKRLLNLPVKLKISRIGKYNGLLTFIKKGWIKNFYFATKNLEVKELEFEKAIQLIETNMEEKKLSIPKNYYDLLELNYKYFISKIEEEVLKNIKYSKLSKNERDLRKFIKASLSILKPNYNQSKVFKNVLKILDEGLLDNALSKRLLLEIKTLRDCDPIINSIKKTIPYEYFQERTNYQTNFSSNQEDIIILSEHFLEG